MAVTPLFTDAAEKRQHIRQKAVEGLKALFPIETNLYRIDALNIKVEPKTFSLADAKKAILEGKSLTEPVTGSLVLKDKTGKVVDRADSFKLLSLPYFTDLHTFVIDGNQYSVGNQLRTKPGIYTRVRRNEVPEVAFNLAKGANFKIVLNPENSIFKIELGTAGYYLYPLLRGLGVEDGKIREGWGSQIWEKNQSLTRAQYERTIAALYERFVPRKEQLAEAKLNEHIAKLRSYFDSTKVDPETTELTLGQPYKSITGDALVKASAKLLAVFRSEVEHDDRDSLEFQKIHTVDDFIHERLVKAGPELIRKLKFKFDSKSNITGLKDVIPSSPFSPTIKSMVTQFTLSRTPDQINPLEVMDAAMKVTRLGEGGIASIRAVPDATRDLHATHLGVLDPVRTPESHNIGVDIRATLATAKDDQGNIYGLVQDVRTGKTTHVPVKELRQKTIAFPNQKLTGMVEAIKDGKVQKVSARSVDYQIPNPHSMLGPSSVLIPFIDNMQGNRALMASKQITQALPLKFREEPLVQVSAPSDKSQFSSTHEMMGSQIIKTAPEDGEVTRVTDDFIFFKGDSGTTHKISYAKDFPFNSKTYLHEDVIAKPGVHVKKGTPLTDSNFTKNGKVALGRNAYVAYLAYHGENSNDAIVISESAAKNYTSMHMYRKVLDLDADTVLDKKYWITQYPNKFKIDQLEKIDEKGVIKKGSVINFGEPVVLAVRKNSPNETDVMLGRLHKGLMNKFRDASILWDHEHAGTVTDVAVTGNRVTVTVKMEAPVVVGDKMAGLHGNKGVVSRIIPDAQMPHDQEGKPFDVLMAPTGVVSRINPSQLLETALGKVAKKTGETIVVENFSGNDKVDAVKKILAHHKVSDKETVIDPVTGRKIPGVMTGYQNFLKLFKSTDTNFGARGVETYDINEQPVTGGEEGAKRVGTMEVNALLAHGANGLLRESMSLKSQKNVDWWNAYKSGMPLPPTKRSFAVDKLNGMLAGAGVKVEQKEGKVLLLPSTDKDITDRSHGTITKADVLRKKDLKPEIGGLFDPIKTGGLEGEKWSDIKLSEPIVKPVFMKPAAAILDMSETALEKLVAEKGGKHVQDLLKQVDLQKLKTATLSEIDTATGAKLDKAVKRFKYVEGLEKAGLKPHEAYTGQHIAVLPPKMRPVVPGPNNQLLVSDANHLYRDVLLADEQLKKLKEAGITHEADLAPIRSEMHKSVAALAGISEPTSVKLREQGKKGFIKQIAGPRPSEGYYQEKVVGRAQDISGRGTIAPDPTLHMNEIGLPTDTAWGMYAPFVVKRLVHLGYKATEAADHVEKKTDVARRALDAEVKERPVIFNRAPTLWRYGMMSAFPKLIPGKTIRLNPYVETPLNADYDGDTVQLHVPVTSPAINDAKNMLPGKLLFSDKSPNHLLAKPEFDAIIGLYESTRLPASGKKFKFKNKAEAMQAYYRGELKANDEVVIG